jgi:hypothetical protein
MLIMWSSLMIGWAAFEIFFLVRGGNAVWKDPAMADPALLGGKGRRTSIDATTELVGRPYD